MGKMSERALLARDAKRDIGAERLESVRQMKRDELHVVYAPAKAARGKTGLSQPPDSTLLAGTKLTPHQAFKVGLRTYAFQCHPECDRELTDILFKCSQDVAKALNLTVADLLAQADRDYAMYARQSDRLAVNLATYLFPVSSRMRV